MPLFLFQKRVSISFLEYDRIGEKDRDFRNVEYVCHFV